MDMAESLAAIGKVDLVGGKEMQELRTIIELVEYQTLLKVKKDIL